MVVHVHLDQRTKFTFPISEIDFISVPRNSRTVFRAIENSLDLRGSLLVCLLHDIRAYPSLFLR